MRPVRLRIVRATLLPVLLMALMVATRLPRGPNQAFDGRWWQATSEREHSGFVAGFLDCYTSDYRGPGSFAFKSLDAYRDLVTAHYTAAGSDLKEGVSLVLARIGRTETDSLQPGPEGDAPRAAFDGLYWMQLSVGGAERQLGFIEGYLSCRHDFMPDQSSQFTKSPIQYQHAVTRWYRFVEESGDIDEKRQRVRIAEALESVAKCSTAY